MTQFPLLSRAQFLKVTTAAAFAAATPAFAAATAPLVTRRISKSKSDEQLPVIGLGTSRAFSDAENIADKTEVIQLLVEAGAKVIDTAASYGQAEDVVGGIVARQKLREKVFIASKFGVQGKDAGIASIENSFKRLKTDKLDLMYIHNMVDADTHLPTLAKYKADGRIRYIGISDTSPQQDRLLTWMDQIDFVEFSYSVGARAAENRLLPAAKDNGVAVFVAIPLGRGRLLSAMQGKEVPVWAREELKCDSFAQLLLKFVVAHPAVTVAIPATSNPKHMADNLAAGRGPMPDEKQRERIAALWKDA